MERKHKIYLGVGLGVLALAGICVYIHTKNKLPEVKDIKVSADGTKDEDRGVVAKLPSQKLKAQKQSNFGGHHGGGGHGGGFGRRGGWGGGWGFPIGFSYPYWGDGDGLCYMKDEFGNTVRYYCNGNDNYPSGVPF